MSATATAVFLPGLDAAAFAALRAPDRAAAFDAYAGAPFPARQMEEWRRTDPAEFPFGGVAFPGLLPRTALAAAPEEAEFDAALVISGSGWDLHDISGALADGRLRIAWGAGEDAAPAADKFSRLNAAFWNAGFQIQVRDGAELPRGLLVRQALDADRLLLLPRLQITAGARSRATLVEWRVSAPGATVLSVSARTAAVGAEAALRVVDFQSLENTACHFSNDWTTVARGGRFDWVALNLGGRRCKLTAGCEVGGEGAAAELGGLYFAAGDQHVDQRTIQVHAAPRTTSNLLYKGAARDQARSVYQGLLVARPGAVQVDAYQKNNNLVLNDGARADSLPGLEIDTDDLNCSHGSTIGNLDEEQIFYLRARGLDERAARRALIQGFFEEIIGRVPFEFIRERVRGQVAERMG